jgi:hypothetical protein
MCSVYAINIEYMVSEDLYNAGFNEIQLNKLINTHSVLLISFVINRMCNK